MDKKIKEILEKKIHKSTSASDEITLLVNSLGDPSKVYGNSPSQHFKSGVEYGIIIGRLYNSFYYQSRRILKRDPTEQEFSEFIKLLRYWFENRFDRDENPRTRRT